MATDNPLATSPHTNWELIEAEYRAGQLSIREIAKHNNISHTAIQNRIKKYTWKRNLTKLVQDEAQRKLINEDTTLVKTRAIDDESIIDQASNRLMEVINLHRKDVATQRALAADLMAQLVTQPTKKVMIGKGADRHEVEIPLSIGDVSGILRNIAQAAAKYIPLERQAYNADSKAPTGSQDDPIHVKHSMDTSGLSKAAGVPKQANPLQIEAKNEDR